MPTAPLHLYPILRYDDAHAALRFLDEAFGFTIQEVHEGSDGGVDHALVAHGADLLMVSSRRPGAGADIFDHGTTVLYVSVDDADAHHQRSVAAGATVVYELTDQPYGSRDYAVNDPEGNTWSFGTYNPQVGETAGAADTEG
jgi:uncharacterized glyoxalase superfamily protein PhnB